MNLKQILNDCWTRVRSIRIGRIFDYVGKIISKLYSFSWRTAIILLVCSAVCFLHDEISWAIKRNTREIVSYRNYLGNDIKVKKFGNGTCYTYDYVKGKRISPKLKWVSTLPERDSLTVFCDRTGLRGFLNVNTGKIEIPGQYYRAWHFSEGLAAVADEEGRVGFINHANEMVIPMDFDRVYGNDYIFLNGYCIIQDKESGLWGAIDTTGEWKLRPEYSGIYNVAGYDLWLVYLEDKEGLYY